MTTESSEARAAADLARAKEIVAEMRRLDVLREALSDELFDIWERAKRQAEAPPRGALS